MTLPAEPASTARSLPLDGTPQRPSPTLAAWRTEAPASPLHYPDGHDGWIVTQMELARAVLAHPAFSQLPHRMPGPGGTPDDEHIDERGEASVLSANLLALDGPGHLRLRRHAAMRFTARAARARSDAIALIVSEQIAELRAAPTPVDIWRSYGEPISVRVHALIVGIPHDLVGTFRELFAGESTRQQKLDFVRAVVDARRGVPGEDVVTDLLESDLTEHEVEGLVLVLLTSGRDSVAYMIATATVALLSNPEQLAALRADPALIEGAVEEIMRFGAMFVTLFPRTATEDLELPGLTVRAGQSVSVSAVAANRDPAWFDHPDEYDISRSGYAHLGFGHGTHGCVGQQVARREVGEALLQLVTAFPEMRLVSAEQKDPLPFAHPVATYEAGEVWVELAPE